MSWVIDKIETLKKKMNKKNQVIALIWDSGGYGEADDMQTVTYKSHTSEITDDDGDVIDMDAVYISDEYGDEQCLDGSDLDDNVKHVMLVKKNFKAKLDKVSGDKTPKNAKRHVGIELEFISRLSKPEIILAMVDAGVEDFVTVKDDGSLDPDDEFQFTHEIAILATEANFETVIKKICKALKGDSKVNTSCGMHVHIDMRTRNVDQSYAALFEAQPVLYAMCPKSRIEGTYSQPEMKYRSVTRHHSGDRYFGVNQTAYLAHQTLEVRVHSGTLLASKIINWIKLLIKVVDAGRVYNLESVTLQRNLAEFKRKAKIRGNLSKYIDQRVGEFQADHANSAIKLVA